MAMATPPECIHPAQFMVDWIPHGRRGMARTREGTVTRPTPRMPRLDVFAPLCALWRCLQAGEIDDRYVGRVKDDVERRYGVAGEQFHAVENVK